MSSSAQTSHNYQQSLPEGWVKCQVAKKSYFVPDGWWLGKDDFLCRAGYFIQFLAQKMYFATWTPIPMGMNGWKNDFSVQI